MPSLTRHSIEVTTEDRPDTSSKWTAMEVMLVLSLALSMFGAYLLSSIVSPFLPQQLQILGASAVTTGLLFALYPFVIIITSLFLGSLTEIVGAVPVLFAGLVILGGSTIAFGVSANSLTLLFVFRGIQGIGGSAASSAVFVLIAQWFSDKKATVTGICEAIAGLGFLAGPTLGGALFGVGGFQLPFIVSGGFLLAMLPPSAFLMSKAGKAGRRATDSEKKPKKPFRYYDLINSTTIIVGFLIVLSEGAFGSIEPTLAIFLQDSFHISESQTGYLFSLAAAAYALLAPVSGYFTEVYGSKISMIGGSIVMGFGFVLLGPQTAIQHDIQDQLGVRWFLLTFSLILLGAGYAFVFVPTFPTLHSSIPNLSERGGEGPMSGLFNLFSAAGQVIGPLMGAGLVSALGFETAAFYEGLALFIYMFLLFFIQGTTPKRKRAQSVKRISSSAYKLMVEDPPSPKIPPVAQITPRNTYHKEFERSFSVKRIISPESFGEEEYI